MRILVSGGAGFVGQAVVRRLRAARYTDITVPRSAEFDLREERAVRRLYELAAPEVVIHLAAVVGGIGANRVNPGGFFYDNLMMGTLLMEHARRAGVRKFVAIGTICSYPKFTPVPFRESDLWNGYPEETNAPYGLAKKMLLVQAQAYRTQYGFPAIYLIPTNMYGPGDSFDPQRSHVVPALIRKCVEAQARGEDRITLWGDGTPTRDFLYVDDAADGIVAAMEQYDSPEPANLGTNQEISIADLAALVCRLVGFRGKIVWNTSLPNGQPRRMVDATRARQAFGFVARTPLEEGLRRTIAWIRSRLDEGPAA